MADGFLLFKQKFVLPPSLLQKSCRHKIAEAEWEGVRYQEPGTRYKLTTPECTVPGIADFLCGCSNGIGKTRFRNGDTNLWDNKYVEDFFHLIVRALFLVLYDFQHSSLSVAYKQPEGSFNMSGGENTQEDPSFPSESHHQNVFDEQSIVNDIVPSTPANSDSNDGVRSFAGTVLHHLTDLVNDNLIAARYGAFATIALVSAYSVAHSPLFFRFKTVSHIPTYYFLKRKKIRCRLVRILEQETDAAEQQSVKCLVRHLSPAGSLLNRAAFDFCINVSPSAAVGRKLEDNMRDLIKVEIGMSM